MLFSLASRSSELILARRPGGEAKCYDAWKILFDGSYTHRSTDLPLYVPLSLSWLGEICVGDLTSLDTHTQKNVVMLSALLS